MTQKLHIFPQAFGVHQDHCKLNTNAVFLMQKGLEKYSLYNRFYKEIISTEKVIIIYSIESKTIGRPSVY